jgi:biotin operon repressor
MAQKTTQKDRVINALSSYRPVSAATLANRLNTSTSRVRFLISELRNGGYFIDTIRRNRKGSSKFAYTF